MRFVLDVRAFRSSLSALAFGAVLAVSGCAHMPFRSTRSPAAVATINGSSLTAPELDSEVLRFADGYVASVSHASDAAANIAGTREAKLEALRWKLDQATAAYLDATGQNPVWNALDMVVLATVSRMVIQDPPSVARRLVPREDRA